MPAEQNILDSFIAVIIILFLLSVIVEKVTQLIRKYSPFTGPNGRGPNFLGMYWRNINKTQYTNNEFLKKRIEREVASLSLILGLIISFAFHVDIFKMFQVSDPRTVLFWDNRDLYHKGFWLLEVLSISLTGFFLTFGSKFFHDLLDVLYQTKNLKKKMLDDNTYQADDIEQFDEYIAKSYSSIIETAIAQNPQLSKIKGAVSPPMHGKMRYNGHLTDCIDIHVLNTASKTPLKINATLDKGQIISIPINFITVGGKPSAQSIQGMEVSSKSQQSTKGTICCKVQSNKDSSVCLMTCSHVITDGKAENHFGNMSDKIPTQIVDNFDLFTCWAVCNDQFDVALIEGASDFEYQIIPNKEKKLTAADLHQEVKVVRRIGSGIEKGKIMNTRVTLPIAITYEKDTNNIMNLMVLSSTQEQTDGSITYSALSRPGDSGACVYDKDNRPIGMIVAGNAEFSFAIPMIDILKVTNTTLIK